MQHGGNGNNVISWATAGARAAHDHVGSDTLVIDVAALLVICDLFVITSGANPRQVKAICEAVEQGVCAAGGPKPLAVEGLASKSWVLMDYGDFVVHVFSEKERDYYQLDRLWGDCPQLAWNIPQTVEAG